MKRRFNVAVSVAMVLVVLTASFAGSASAALFGYNMSPEQWDTYWQEYSSDGSSLHMAPGRDSSEMNFSWLGTSEDNNPAVYVRPLLSLGEYSEFTGVCVKLDGSSFSYKVTVTGLNPNTTYLYYYSANSNESDVSTFTTARADRFSAIYVSDIHVSLSEESPDNLKNTSYELNKVFAEAYEKEPEVSIIVSAGDQADHGLLSEYSGVFSSPIVKNIPIATTCGNHDYKETVYASVTNNPNMYNGKQPLAADRNGGDYYFVKGDVLFLFINSNWTSASDHYDFVNQTVEENSDVKWRIVVMHHDLYGGHLESRESENRLLRLMFVPIFDEFGIDVVLTGHSHVFSRSHVMYGGNIATDIAAKNTVTDANGTIYITTGSTCRPRGDVGPASSAIAFDYVSGEDFIYNIIDFTYDAITFNSYTKDQNEPFEVFTLEKTSNEGGHPDIAHNEMYYIVGNIGTVVSIFQNLSFIFEKIFTALGISL